MNKKIKKKQNEQTAILFDLDGTLLDSFSAHYEAYRVMFRRFGIRITMRKFHKTYSPNWYKTYEALKLPQESWKLADRYWLEEIERRPAELFEGVPRMLRKLHGLCKVGLVTSGSKPRVLKDLKYNRVDSIFDVVVTGGDVRNAKPHPEGLRKALYELGVKATNAMYVGDALADYEMAQALGMRFIGVRSNFSVGKPKAPYPVVSSLSEIPKTFLKGNL